MSGEDENDSRDQEEVDRDKELSDRFTRRAQPKRETDETGDPEEAHDTQDTNDAEDTDGDEPDESGAVRDRQQYVMYLPPELHDALNERYQRYDGIAKLSGLGGVEKHREFNEAIVRAALDHPDLDDYVGVRSTLDDDDDEKE